MSYNFSIIKRIWNFYFEGFRNLSWWGKKVWLIIVIKLFIIFAILKLFFFHDFLESRFPTEGAKSDYVMDQLIKPPQ